MGDYAISRGAPALAGDSPGELKEAASERKPASASRQHSEAYASVPRELKDLRHWVNWLSETRGGRPTKVPINPRTGQRAKSNDPATWSDFGTALAAAGKYNGVGYMIRPPYVGIDLDKVRDLATGAVEEWALGVIDALASYTELSPSGRGFHILVRSTLPAGGRRKGRIEVYSSGRYFTVTGQHVPGTPVTIEQRDLTPLLGKMLAGELEPGAKLAKATHGPATSGPLAATSGSKLSRLMAGAWEGLYSSQSEADLALCTLLALKHDGDAVLIDAEFRRSALMRPKWDRSDYKEATIAKAIASAKNGGRRDAGPVVEILSERGAAGLPVIEVAEPETAEDAVPPFPALALDGDLIGDLSHILSDGTQIPPQFVRSNIKTILGAAINGRVGFPSQEDIHTRLYNLNISVRERTGKGESWKRTGRKGTGLLNSLLEEEGVNIVDGGLGGSGQYLVKVLSEGVATSPNYSPLIRFDEMKELFQRDQIRASTLETELLKLYEETGIAQGSFTNGEYQVEGVHLSLAGDFTRDGFEASFAGRRSRGSGFLARCVLSYGDKIPHEGDWLPYDDGAAIATVAGIRACLDRLPARVFGDVHACQARLVPREDPLARDERYQFYKWLAAQDPRFTGELTTHCKRDLLLRATFSGAGVITRDLLHRSIAWTSHQLELRQLLWPEDSGGPVERMERKIVDVLRKYGPQSDRALIQRCNVAREGSGGREVYSRALRALTCGTHEVVRVGLTSRGRPVWGLAQA